MMRIDHDMMIGAARSLNQRLQPDPGDGIIGNYGE
jgi:hypothetical protein